MESRDCPPSVQRGLPLAFLLLVALLAALIALPGCGGCTSGGGNTAAAKKKKEDDEKEKEAKKKKKKAEKPKEDFEPLAIRMLPSSDPTQNVRTPPLHVKPGHWIAVSETLKANNFDYPGELATFAEAPATNRPLEVENTTQLLSVWCPAILPKGQAKRIETLFYLPRGKPGLNSAYSLRTELRGARGGRTEVFATTRTTSMKDYQFLIVVLSDNPAAYAQFDKLNSIKMSAVEAPGETSELSGETLRHYHVVVPNSDRTVPLPSHPLAWTTTAFVFWDNINPTALTNLQQEALLDWIHWGGQLVISGPGSLEKLRGTFLGPFLPGEATQTVKLEQTAFDELNQTFSLQRDPARQSDRPAPTNDPLRRINILPERPMLGVELKLHPAAEAVAGTGGLVVERRVGSGRIAVTRFPLTDVRIKQWKNFDGFFNSVLLRRPARIFGQTGIAQLAVNWKEPQLRSMLFEPRIGSTLRYFTRDVGYPAEDGMTPLIGGGATTAVVKEPSAAPAFDPRTARAMAMGGFGGFEEPTVRRVDTSGTHPDLDDWHFGGYHSSSTTGVAAWNDTGSASEAARTALTDAAGIEIPKAEFVMKVLGVYLLVLVPLNWLVFWLIGRVEWAWIAAPIIAVVGAGAVIRLAQLDIGFARNRTEIAVLEVQGGYERAHLTRYTALYTSLSSNYTAAFDNNASLALPFPGGKRDESLLTISHYTDVLFRRDKEVSLSGIQVYSNETGMIHSEQMLPLGKNPKINESLVLAGDEQKGYSVRNTTDITVRDVGVIRRVDKSPPGSNQPQQQIETAYIAKLEPATSSPLKFTPLATGDFVWLPEWDQSTAFSAASSTRDDRGHVRMRRLAQLASQRLRLMPGDVRLIGWSNDLLPGLELRPAAPQNSTYTLVLAHLARGTLPSVKADANVAEDYVDPTIDPEPDPADTTTTGGQ
jgi:hypothetical protein